MDGAYHLGIAQQKYDHERTLKLEALGFTVIRFENKEVYKNLEVVLESICDSFKK